MKITWTFYMLATNYNASLMMYLSVALYTPSLALESVAGVPIYITIISTGVVCTFYTSLGGMRAVVWTDVFQSAIMFTGLLTTLVIGAREAGSFQDVIDINSKMKRLEINYSLDPRELHTIWGSLIGRTITALPTWTMRQTLIQRFVAAKSLKQAQGAMMATYFGIAVVMVILTLDGLIIYAVYSTCDLVISKRIRRNDQILPYFVVDKMGHLTGLPGLITASLFSFALSSLSSGLNAISALMLEDIVKKLKPGITDKQGTYVSKITAIASGVFMTSFAFAVPYLGKYVIRITVLLSGILGGPTFALFALGIFSRKSNKLGVSIGAIIGAFIGFFFSIGQMFHPPKSRLPPISVRGCSFFNATTNSNTGIINRANRPISEKGFAELFSISYLWVGAMPLVAAILFGYLISICTNGYVKQKEIDDTLLYDWNRIWLFKSNIRKKKSPKYKFARSDKITADKAETVRLASTSTILENEQHSTPNL